MATVAVNNIGMYYVEEGRGPALLLLHGIGGSHEMWLPVIRELSQSYRVIAADHRGHGGSDRPRGQYTIRTFADDWLGLMDALKVDRAHVLGLSMGGAIAMRLGVDAPERIRSLILVGTWAYPHPGLMRQRLEKLARNDLEGYAEVAIPQVFSPRFIATNP
jgi:pimeloyl-ACP methyl ester carboxylesterase